MKTLLVFFFLLAAQGLFAQAGDSLLTVKGTVLDSLTAEPCAFAKVTDLRSNKAVLCDIDGHFEVSVSTESTLLRFSSQGYRTNDVTASTLLTDSIVRLPENAEVLEEYILVADNSFMYELLAGVFKEQEAPAATAKTYVQLSSFLNGAQVELIESYYNGVFSGNNIKRLDYKEGRSAIAMASNTSFVSKETASAIIALQLDRKNDYLPDAPFAYNERQMQKLFGVVLNKVTKDDQGHTVYIVSFHPKKDTGKYFSGSAWIDSNDRVLQRLVLQIDDAAVYPFIPLWPEDSILHVSFDLNYVFSGTKEQHRLDYLYFDYGLTYVNRDRQRYDVLTDVFLHPYDYGSTFILPVFESPATKSSDYRKLQFFPYNAAFWQTVERPVSMEQAQQNEFFFYNEAILLNSENIVNTDFFSEGQYETPLTFWKPARIGFLPMASDTVMPVNYYTSQPNSVLYNLAGKIYADIHESDGKLVVLTKTVFDPYESFYKLERDSTTNCFLNLYFDLVEIERRKLEQHIGKHELNRQEVFAALAETDKTIAAITARYLKEVDHGSNRKSMEKWNALVLQELGIDNFKLLGLSEEE